MKILNFGSVNIDNVYQVPHFLQPGETLLSTGYARFPGGKGFNQSVALARAGATVFHAGHVGADGAWLVDFLRAEGVNVDFLTTVDAPTGHANIEVDPSGQNRILLEGGANQRLTADDIRAALTGVGIGKGDIVLLQNETSATADILRLASAAGATVAFNAAPMTPAVLDLPLECVGLFIVNEIEGAALAGTDAKADGYAMLNALRDKFPAADVLLTLGTGGCLYGRADDRVNSSFVPARSVRAVDTTAAGDTFIGYFLADLAKGTDPLFALDHATSASAYSVAHAGAAPSIPRPADHPAPWDRAAIRGTTDKDPVSYAVGEEIVFTLAFENAPSAADAEDYTVRWTRKGDDGVTEEGSLPAADMLEKPLVLRTSLACPGFVSVVATLHGPDGRPAGQPIQPNQWWAPLIAFEGGAGADIASLRGEPEPEDFDAFWTRQKAKLADVPVRATRVDAPSPTPGVRLYAVTIDCPGPRPVTGYLSIPEAASAEHPFPAQAGFQGYGMHAPVTPCTVPTDVIRLEINAHGVEIGREPAYYNAHFQSIFSHGYTYAFDPEENKDPENAYFTGMALRVLRALQYLKTLPEWNGKDLVAVGGSQGGLQSIWAAALDPDVTEARPEVPWCCDLAGITTNRMASPWHIPYVRGIDYFDPVNHARRVRCPVHIPRAGLGDYTCPPSGITILYNNLPGPKSIRYVQGSTHGYVPHEPNQDALRRQD